MSICSCSTSQLDPQRQLWIAEMRKRMTGLNCFFDPTVFECGSLKCTHETTRLAVLYETYLSDYSTSVKEIMRIVQAYDEQVFIEEIGDPVDYVFYTAKSLLVSTIFAVIIRGLTADLEEGIEDLQDRKFELKHITSILRMRGMNEIVQNSFTILLEERFECEQARAIELLAYEAPASTFAHRANIAYLLARSCMVLYLVPSSENKGSFPLKKY